MPVWPLIALLIGGGYGLWTVLGGLGEEGSIPASSPQAERAATRGGPVVPAERGSGPSINAVGTSEEPSGVGQRSASGWPGGPIALTGAAPSRSHEPVYVPERHPGAPASHVSRGELERDLGLTRGDIDDLESEVRRFKEEFLRLGGRWVDGLPEFDERGVVADDVPRLRELSDAIHGQLSWVREKRQHLEFLRAVLDGEPVPPWVPPRPVTAVTR